MVFWTPAERGAIAGGFHAVDLMKRLMVEDRCASLKLILAVEASVYRNAGIRNADSIVRVGTKFRGPDKGILWEHRTPIG